METKNEKISININLVDLGKIDLLVDNYIYSNRTEFVKTAITNELQRNGKWLAETFIARQIELGAVSLTKEMLQTYGEKTNLTVIGYLTIPEGISLESVKEKLNNIRVFGKCKVPQAIKEHYKL